MIPPVENLSPFKGDFMQWKEFTYQIVCEYCNRKGNRTFTLHEFFEDSQLIFKDFAISKYKDLRAKIRQLLQQLRDDGLLTFVDNRGTYTLRGIEILDGEVEDAKVIEISKAEPIKREYLVETYVRNVGWAKQAKEVFGHYCLYDNCTNTFLKSDGTPYVEVHHIIPLCEGGEDGIWNLSVLCAHHHKMAHFGDNDARFRLRDVLLREVQNRL